MERKGMQVIKDVASKTAGLVFFSLLAIALGIVFGVMFERWVGPEQGVPTTGGDVQTPFEELTMNEPAVEPSVPGTAEPAPVVEGTAVKFKVKVGPYPEYTEAAKAADNLRAQGYPVYLANKAPYLIQVGAFANRDNALSLKAELTGKGFTVAVQPE